MNPATLARGSARTDARGLWLFRALPREEQESTIRRLAVCGLPAAEIAARTGWSSDRVGQVMRERFAQSAGSSWTRGVDGGHNAWWM
jgi:hypothetical protein